MGVSRVLDRQRVRAMDVHRDDVAAHARPDDARALAFRRLADRHLDHSYRLATVVLGDSVEAQDAVHDAFVTAWRKWGSLRDPACFEAWFGRIVVNTCRDRMRRAHRWQVRELTETHDRATADPTAGVADRIVVRRALDRLKPDDRVVLALRYYCDLKVDDIAAMVDISPRAATSRLHRALGRLRGILDQHDGREAAS